MKRLSKQVRRERISKDFNLPFPALMSLFVILIPFLLSAAIFTKTAILNLYLPSTRPAAADQPIKKQKVVPTIVIRKSGFLLQVGVEKKRTISLKDDKYNFDKLQEELIAVREEFPEGDSAVIFVEPQVPYGLVVTTMDTVREYKTEEEGEPRTEPLYPMISLGEYRPPEKKRK